MNTQMKRIAIQTGSPHITEEYAEKMGRDCRDNGANTTNCHFALFNRPALTKAWERGRNGDDTTRDDTK